MRIPFAFLLLAGLAWISVTAQADELTYSLVSNVGYGSATGQNPDPDFCAPPNCVLFTGTLMDNDVDPSLDTNPTYLGISTPYTAAADMTDFALVLSIDNVAPTGVLSGDTNYATDNLGNPPNIYQGPIFGVDIPAGTPVGDYVDAVYLEIYPTNGNSPFTVSQTVDVVVIPEPSALWLSLAGLVLLVAWRGLLCGRRFS